MFIDELKSYIDTNSSLTFGTTLFVGNMPEGVNNCVVLQMGNSDLQYECGNRLGYSTINIPIRVRGDLTENTTRTIANTLQTLLENLTVTLTSYRIVKGMFETPFYQLDGTDQNNNYIFVGIYQCIIEVL